MNYQQYLDLEGEPPVKLADGKFGLLIRGDEQEVGIQVPGEEQIRWIPLASIEIVGDGELIEIVGTKRSFDGYRHREAFAIMKYAAEDGSEVEWIWNSRDGVTPSYVSNRAGDKILKHVDWHLDRCIFDYRPMPCERIFVDLSPQKARQKAECFIKDLWDSNDDCSYVREKYDTKEDAVEGLLASFRVEKAPDLVESSAT